MMMSMMGKAFVPSLDYNWMIFYININDWNSLYRINLDWTSDTKITDINIPDNSVTNNIVTDLNYFYYSNLNDSKKIYRCNMDWSNHEKIFDISNTSYNGDSFLAMSNNYIFTKTDSFVFYRINKDLSNTTNLWWNSGWFTTDNNNIFYYNTPLPASPIKHYLYKTDLLWQNGQNLIQYATNSSYSNNQLIIKEWWDYVVFLDHTTWTLRTFPKSWWISYSIDINYYQIFNTDWTYVFYKANDWKLYRKNMNWTSALLLTNYTTTKQILSKNNFVFYIRNSDWCLYRVNKDWTWDIKLSNNLVRNIIG